MRDRRIVAMLAALCAVGLIVAEPCRAQEQIRAEAYADTPFGVGRVTISSGGDFRVRAIPRPGGGRIANLAKRLAEQAGKGNDVQLESAEMALVEKSSRAFYPVFEKRERPILQQFVSVPTESTIFFLFQGDAPLELTVYAPEPRTVQVVPRRDPTAHAGLVGLWWRDYSSAGDGRDADGGYPRMVEEYLTDTLARRMELPLPERASRFSISDLLRGELNLLFETETVRLELAESILLGRTVDEAATVQLPEELPAPKPESLNPPPDVPIEAIAARVPVECLYVRFGNFPNFLWLRHRLEDWGGELRDVFSERGLDFGLNDRFQRQLGLRESALAEVLGEKVIADVALIGCDTFMHEGSAIGTLFHAKSNPALTADLTNQRRSAMREVKGAKEEKLTISGRPVSYISSPDGAIRSYYVVDGDFHLVSTCRTMVEWFLATGDGQHESLAASEEFRYTRATMPLSRDDTVFVYLSPDFFKNLLSAHYQIELKRRLRSAVEIELFPIAQLAARSEGKAGTTIEELIGDDLLPKGFGEHADGSRLVEENGQLVDSIRGAKGMFLPVPDVKIDKVTPAEVAEYRQFKDTYVEQWGAMDPLVLGIRREALPEGKLERVVLDVRAAPLAPQHVETLSRWLGEPTLDRLAPVSGDVVAFEAVLRGGTFFSGGEHHLFGALRNADPSIALDPRAGVIAMLLKSQFQGLQGYLGAWPDAGYLRLLGAGIDIQQPDAAGYSRLLTGMTRRQLGPFTLTSFYPEILSQISPQLRFVKAERPAQIWFRADDLANSTLAPLINAYGYRQSRQITEGNARFMNMLIEQLHVPAAECLSTGERILGAKFISPLGGKYELRKWDGGLENWVATALVDQPDASQVPKDYQFRALTWLRGVQFELAMQKGPQPALSAHGEFIMPVEHRAPAFQLPSLPKPAAKGAKKPAEKPPTKATEKPKPGGKKEF